MPLPEENTFFVSKNNVISLKAISKSDRNYIAQMRSPNETPEDLKLPKSKPTNALRICKRLDLRSPHLVVATVDFENWEVIAASERSSTSGVRQEEIKQMKEILTLFFFDESRQNGNRPINIGLRGSLNTLLKETLAELPLLFAENPDFEVIRKVEAPAAPKKASGPAGPSAAPKKGTPRAKKARSKRNLQLDVESVHIPAAKSSYYMIGLNEREIKSTQARKAVQRLRSAGEEVNVYRISRSDARNAPHIVVTTSDYKEWSVRAVTPSKLDDAQIHGLQEVFTLFFCLQSQENGHKPISVSMKSMPTWLVDEHLHALKVFEACPDLTIIETLLNDEAAKKPVRKTSDNSDNENKPAGTSQIDRIIAGHQAKVERLQKQSGDPNAGFEGTSEEEWDDFFRKRNKRFKDNHPEAIKEVPGGIDALINMVHRKSAGSAGTGGRTSKKRSPSAPKPPEEPKDFTPPTPIEMMARQRLMQSGAVPNTIDWNTIRAREIVAAEVERFNKQRAAAKLGQGKTTIATPETPAPQGDGIKAP